MSHPVKAPKKLIEVALPLDVINAEAGLRKRKAPAGYPTTLHAWWAQRPVAAARAILFAQLVNDPASLWDLHNPGKVPSPQQRGGFTQRRKYLFQLIGELVKWENSNNETVLEKAHEEISRSWREICELNRDHPDAERLFDPNKLPAVHDPFAGGGTIPLEAQRLGLEVRAADLNPVAVLINKALVEFPPRFGGRPPVGPVPSSGQSSTLAWLGASGLAEDVRRYGVWLRDEAEHRIGKFYPPFAVTTDAAKNRSDLKGLIGKKLPVVAWIWARTVRSPSPAYSHVHVPLVSTFVLSSKEGKQVFVEPIRKGDSYSFKVRTGKPPVAAKQGTKAGGSHSSFLCLLSGAPMSFEYIRTEFKGGHGGARLMAVVVEGERGRLYMSPTKEQEAAALRAKPQWTPDQEISHWPGRTNVVEYGLTRFGDLFTSRQLVTLSTLCDLVGEVRSRASNDARAAGWSDDGKGLEVGGAGATAYGEAIGVYLSFGISRVADYGSSISTWRPKDNAMRAALGNKNIPMTWDFAEGSPLGGSSSGILEAVNVVARVLDFLPRGAVSGVAAQAAAQDGSADSTHHIVSTDPPYYHNVAYAELADFFYVWLRRSQRSVLPSLFGTVAVPKAEELVATQYRHGSKENAEKFFLDGMTEAMHRLALVQTPGIPVTIYYAFKQSETEADTGTSSSGWETFLEAVLRAGFALTGTWPVRTEGDNRQAGNEANALASSIVLVCRPRAEGAPAISRREFIRELNAVLPGALEEMTRGAGEEDVAPIAPVDLSQAIIGPGMAVFSKYSAVLEADGSTMTVKAALQIINRFLGEDDFDADTQFCLHWFDQFGWNESLFGEADKLARAKATSVEGLDDAGVLFSGRGKVRLRKWSDYPDSWDPRTDKRLPIWEALHQLIRVFKQDGESGAGKVLAVVQPKSEAIRQLAYRLYTLCERKGWAEDARAYNELVTAWSAIESSAGREPKRDEQLKLFGGAA